MQKKIALIVLGLLTITAFISPNVSNAVETRNETYSPNFPLLDGTLTFLTKINFTTVNGNERKMMTIDQQDTVEVKSILDSNASFPEGLEWIMVNQTITNFQFIQEVNGNVNFSATDFIIRYYDHFGDVVAETSDPSVQYNATFTKTSRLVKTASTPYGTDNAELIAQDDLGTEMGTDLGLAFPTFDDPAPYFMETQDMQLGQPVGDMGTVAGEKTIDGQDFWIINNSIHDSFINVDSLYTVEKQTGLIYQVIAAISLGNTTFLSGSANLTSGLELIDNDTPTLEITEMENGIYVTANDTSLQKYQIYVDGTLNREGYFNDSSFDGDFSFDDLPEGQYNVTVVVWDAFQNNVTKQLSLNITHPTTETITNTTTNATSNESQSTTSPSPLGIQPFATALTMTAIWSRKRRNIVK